jgi:hypothetical protein
MSGINYKEYKEAKDNMVSKQTIDEIIKSKSSLIYNDIVIATQLQPVSPEEFPNIKFEMIDEPIIVSPYEWLFSTVGSIVQGLFGPTCNLVSDNESVGDFILLPKDIVVDIKTQYDQKFFFHYTYNGFTDGQGRGTNYHFKYGRVLVYETSNFRVYRIVPDENGLIFKLETSFKHMLHLFSFGNYIVKPYIKYDQAGGVAFWNVGRMQDVSAYGWLPENYRNTLIGKTHVCYDQEALDNKVRGAIATTYYKNANIPSYDLDCLAIASKVCAEVHFNKPEPLSPQERVKYGVDCGTIDYPVAKGTMIDLSDYNDDDVVESKPAAWEMWPTYDKEIYVPADTPNNAAQALSRQLHEYECMVPEDEVYHDFQRFVNFNFKELFPIEQIQVMDYMNWLNHLRSDQQQRYLDYRKYQMLSNYDYNNRDKAVGAFIKKEFHFKKSFVPRFISGCKPQCNIQLGKYIYSVAQCLKSLWNNEPKAVNCTLLPDFYLSDSLCSNLILAMGLNRDQLGDIINQRVKKYNNLYCMSTDYSRYDAHVSLPLLALEHNVYCKLINNPNLKKLLDQQLHTIGSIGSRKSKYNFKYAGYGKRGSGFQNTSIGNSVLNILMQLYVLNKQFDVIKALKEDKLTIMFMGDDTLMLIDGILINKMKYDEDMAKLGMNVKSDQTTLTDAKFLSGYFIPCKRVVKGVKTDTYVHVPLMGKSLQKSGWTIQRYLSDDAKKSWRWQNALQYRSMFSMIPFMSHWFDLIYHDNYNGRRVHMRERHLQTEYNYECSKLTEAWFYDRYGLSSVDLDTLDQCFKYNYKTIDFTHPLILRIIALDMEYTPESHPNFEGEYPGAHDALARTVSLNVINMQQFDPPNLCYKSKKLTRLPVDVKDGVNLDIIYDVNYVETHYVDHNQSIIGIPKTNIPSVDSHEEKMGAAISSALKINGKRNKTRNKAFRKQAFKKAKHDNKQGPSRLGPGTKYSMKYSKKEHDYYRDVTTHEEVSDAEADYKEKDQ